MLSSLIEPSGLAYPNALSNISRISYGRVLIFGVFPNGTRGEPVTNGQAPEAISATYGSALLDFLESCPTCVPEQGCVPFMRSMKTCTAREKQSVSFVNVLCDRLSEKSRPCISGATNSPTPTTHLYVMSRRSFLMQKESASMRVTCPCLSMRMLLQLKSPMTTSCSWRLRTTVDRFRAILMEVSQLYPSPKRYLRSLLRYAKWRSGMTSSPSVAGFTLGMRKPTKLLFASNNGTWGHATARTSSPPSSAMTGSEGAMDAMWETFSCIVHVYCPEASG